MGCGYLNSSLSKIFLYLHLLKIKLIVMYPSFVWEALGQMHSLFPWPNISSMVGWYSQSRKEILRCLFSSILSFNPFPFPKAKAHVMLQTTRTGESELTSTGEISKQWTTSKMMRPYPFSSSKITFNTFFSISYLLRIESLPSTRVHFWSILRIFPRAFTLVFWLGIV